MVAASGPTGILAGRPISTSQTQSQHNHWKDDHVVVEKTKRRHESDLYIRPSWTDAAIALDQLEKGKAEGQRSAVWIRARFQYHFSQLGSFLQSHAGKVLFVAILALATFSVALKSVQVHNKVEQLWVQEGGRLQKELDYTLESLGEATPSTHQLVIQTPKHSGANILHPAALKEHLAIIKAATQVTVELFETTWKLKDLCYAPSIPNFEMYYIDQIFEKIIPCAIITPLDCFWEGSKLLGPEYPVQIPGVQSNQYVQWTNLNPIKMLEQMKELPFMFPFKTLEEYMKRSGITNGYQSKPCLDPMDPNCPDTAPNKKSHQIPDVGVELTGGCYGFAANYMHWPEELVVGGARHNKTGHLIRAAALQTVVQLMGERELYEFLSNDYKVHHIDWSQEKASQVLNTWQRAFSNQIKKQQQQLKASGSPVIYNSYAFSTTTMNDILGKYSEISIINVIVGCGLIILYSGLAMVRWYDPVRSQAGVAIAGVMLVCATVAAGLGFCALLGIPFNAVTTQIVPFLALGLGVHDMFLLTHTYATESYPNAMNEEETRPLSSKLSSSMIASLPSRPRDNHMHTSVVLKRTGLSVLLKGLSNVSAFFAAAIIPIPALRVFSLQAGILILFNLSAMLLVFPAMVSLDLRRRRSRRSDIFCCCYPDISVKTNRDIVINKPNNVKPPISKIKVIPPDQIEPLTHTLTNLDESWICDDSNNVNIDIDYEKELGNGKRNNTEKEIKRDREGAKEKEEGKEKEKRNDDDASLYDDGVEEKQTHMNNRCKETGQNDRHKHNSQSHCQRPQENHWQDNYHQQQQQDYQHKYEEKIGYSEEDTLTGCTQDECLRFSLTHIAAKHYAPFVTKPSTKVFGMMLLAAILGGSAWQAMRVDNGLELGDLVPQNSEEHSFLVAQAKYFGFYNMYAVTGRDFEYPNNQKLLYEYHDAFMRVKNVIKNDDGGLPKFWLDLFRDWLRGLQMAFDKDYKNGCITQERWYKNASDEAILAYKLLVQTGHVDNPIDKTLITQVRLVNSEGIINPRAFYNYLSAWTSNDALAYGASQANLRPEPRQWIFTSDHELKIPKSMPLTYAQMPFYLHKLTDTNEITELIGSVRKLCRKFEERGLPNFPSGIPFLFWEQYMDLRSGLTISLFIALGASIAIVGVLLLNLWAALLVGTALAGIVLQLFGVMGLVGIKLSAVPAVLLVISVGISVHFIADVCLSFVTSVGGNRDRRVRLALEHMFAPVIHGAITILLSIIMLAFSDFEFIVRYFFFILVCLTGIGLLNGLFFFPILLSLIGPSAEIIPPHNHPDRISTPTPPASPAIMRRRRSKPPVEPPRRPHKIDNSQLHTEPSLTTITEEPNSWHSTQESCIIVQPEVKVETTSTCGNQNCNGLDASRTSPLLSNSHVTTTKVTATANIKVQVHTPLSSGIIDRGEKCRHSTSADSRRSTRCSTNVYSNSEHNGGNFNCEPTVTGNRTH
ncbi:hypothetical protein PV328_003065 [Microctonus aethiopoides]|uniref:SSD domain-containing protein n=1 Tax=Microctonus aethiopoides TaxID=144406 RepID=A0AA39F7U5_9HYME|nr:hypothetical protein PV328_003065 [Microctonus aethiopoides]